MIQNGYHFAVAILRSVRFGETKNKTELECVDVDISVRDLDAKWSENSAECFVPKRPKAHLMAVLVITVRALRHGLKEMSTQNARYNNFHNTYEVHQT